MIGQFKLIIAGVFLAGLLGAGGFAYWEYTSTKAENKELHNKLQAREMQVREQKLTIDTLQENSKEQRERATTLEKETRKLNAEITEYLQIFREHDLTALARAKPGLIETRINSGTEDVFKQIEAETSTDK